MRNEQKAATGPLVAAILLAVVLSVCYVLSIGPASRLVSRERLNLRVYKVVYAPLFWCRRSKVCNQLLESYVDLWLGS